MGATMSAAPEWHVRCDHPTCGTQTFIHAMTLEDAVVKVERLGWVAGGGRILCHKPHSTTPDTVDGAQP